MKKPLAPKATSILIKAKPKEEPRTTAITVKVKKSVSEALLAAAEDHGRSRSELLSDLAEIWLGEMGYLPEARIKK